jgi:hypothetical protein
MNIVPTLILTRNRFPAPERTSYLCSPPIYSLPVPQKSESYLSDFKWEFNRILDDVNLASHSIKHSIADDAFARAAQMVQKHARP